MELTVCRADGSRAFVARAFALDQKAGSGGERFEARLPASLYDGSLLHGAAYVDGAEWGGVVDDLGMDWSGKAPEAVLSGRTWRGMLAAVVLGPDGESGLEARGDANRAIAALLGRAGAGAPFSAAEADAGFDVSCALPRFCTLLEGIERALASAGSVLRVRRAFGRVELSAERAAPVRLDAREAGMFASVRTRPVNHLVCAGEGEGGERAVVHLYADDSGVVSREQSLFWPDEVAELYEFTGADEARLVEDGTKRLEGYQVFADADAEVPEWAELRVGDSVEARDPATGFSASIEVSGVSASVGRRGASLEFEAEAAASAAGGRRKAWL